jgi:iron complex outermembrane receptor protein
MLKFIITATGLLVSLCSYAQYAVRGTVTDAKTNQALAGASVSLAQASKVVITDELGHFTFENVSPGKYAIQTTYVGYASAETSADVTSDVTLNIVLEPVSVFTDEVVVSAIRATDKTPTTYTNVDKDAIRKQNFGQDVPFLLNWTPSTVTTSDAGTGVGYTGIRIRGSDGTRINVTINGIPYNDSESLGTFWVDIPDIAASSQSIQIQRGVGTSTNGAGAFGASINLQTNVKNDKSYAELINTFGSFKTHRHTLGFGTGLLNNHFVLEGRVSKINSDGFIDRASSDLSSYYFSGGYYSKNTIFKAIVFGGKEITYQSWYGTPESKLKNDTEAMEETVINEGWNDVQRANLFNSDSRTYNPYFYKNQVDNYKQDHYQLHFSHQFSSAVTWNTALHFTPGKGYYEEYRFADNLENYGIAPVTIGDSVVTTTDLIRRRWLDNKFYGLTWSLNIDKNAFNIVWGGGANRYDGDHYGQLLWAQVSPVPTEYQYYFNNGDKRDFNSFVKTNYQISSKLNAFVDLQFRKITYKASGIENSQEPVGINADFNFFNPKLGLTYALSDRNQLYGSFAISHREPLRDDFLASPANSPTAEKLGNLEIGLRNAGAKHTFHANYYLMRYKDQLVLKGVVNDVGASVRINAGESYRTGLELEGAFKLAPKLQWNANLTLSRNKIQSYTEVLEDYGDNFDEFKVVEVEHKKTNISFSPDIIAGSQLIFHPFSGSEIALLTKYVGKQYLDNTSNEARTLDAYLTNDVRISYTWQPQHVKAVVFSFLINNILNETYESNGYTWGYLAGSYTYRANYYYPQAGRNFMAMLSIRI